MWQLLPKPYLQDTHHLPVATLATALWLGLCFPPQGIGSEITYGDTVLRLMGLRAGVTPQNGQDCTVSGTDRERWLYIACPS